MTQRPSSKSKHSPPSLLEATFLHAQGIGRATEQRLWDAGAANWDAYLNREDSEWPLTRSQRDWLTPTVQESQTRLADEDYGWFAAKLVPSEHWRAVPAFGDRLLFLDIETNGGTNSDDITVIGAYDGFRMHQFVKGQNLEQFPEVMDDAAVMVTFFGTGFDIPFLRRAFPDPAIFANKMHVDLCPMLRRLGLRGGLKRIEAEMGITRSSATSGLSGWDAVRLWQEYQRGREQSLETLLEYNAEDVRNMTDLLADGYRKMARRVLNGE